MRTSGEIDEICKKALEEYLNTPEEVRSLVANIILNVKLYRKDLKNGAMK